MWQLSDLGLYFEEISYHRDRLGSIVGAYPGGLDKHPDKRIIWPWLHLDDVKGRTVEARLKWDQYSFQKVFIDGGKTWTDLCSLLGRYFVVLWISDTTFLTTESKHSHNTQPRRMSEVLDCQSYGNLGVRTDSAYPDTGYLSVIVCSISEDEPTEDLKRLFQLIAQTSDARQVVIEIGFPNDVCRWRPSTFAIFLQSILHINLNFNGYTLPEDHCRLLSSFRGSVELDCCTQEDSGASVLESVRRNQGPVELSINDSWDEDDVSYLDFQLLQDCLRQTISLRALAVVEIDGLDRALLPLVEAVKSNSTICELSFGNIHEELTSADWILAIESLLTHPSLTKIGLFFGVNDTDDENELERSRAVANGLRANTRVRELDIMRWVVDPTIFDGEIRPLLRRNVRLHRIKALLEGTMNPAQRKEVFRSLIAFEEVRTSPLLMWTLASTCQDVVLSSGSLPSETEEGRALKRRRVEGSTDDADDEHGAHM